MSLDALCKYSNSERCLLHSEHFGTFLSAVTIALLAIAALLNLLLIFLARGLEIYKLNKRYSEDDVHESEENEPSGEDDEIHVDNEESSRPTRRETLMSETNV